MISKASIVVLTSVPFGQGNLRNLEAALEAKKRRIPTYVINEVPIEARDFTGGKALFMMAQLKKLGAIFVDSQSELPALLNITKDKEVLAQKNQPAEGHVKQQVGCPQNEKPPRRIGLVYVPGALPCFEDFRKLPTDLVRADGLVDGKPASEVLDMIIIPGGSLVESGSVNETLTREIVKMAEAGKFVLGICAGFQVLPPKKPT